MIQFNLLPDVKLEYIKSRRSKHTILVISLIVGGVSLGILILLFIYVGGIQKKSISDLTKDIKQKSTKLETTPDLDKILTIQNQVASLNCADKASPNPEKCLHDQKPVTSRLFTYLPQLSPNTVSFSNLNIEFGTSTISIAGNADAISTVNKFVDTLKFTDYKVEGEEGTTKAFSNVVLSSFGLNQEEKDPNKRANYSITFTFDPKIFNSTKNIKLVVPDIISTRSETEKPNALFDSVKQPTPEAN